MKNLVIPIISLFAICVISNDGHGQELNPISEKIKSKIDTLNKRLTDKLAQCQTQQGQQKIQCIQGAYKQHRDSLLVVPGLSERMEAEKAWYASSTQAIEDKNWPSASERQIQLMNLEDERRQRMGLLSKGWEPDSYQSLASTSKGTPFIVELPEYYEHIYYAYLECRVDWNEDCEDRIQMIAPEGYVACKFLGREAIRRNSKQTGWDHFKVRPVGGNPCPAFKGYEVEIDAHSKKNPVDRESYVVRLEDVGMAFVSEEWSVAQRMEKGCECYSGSASTSPRLVKQVRTMHCNKEQCTPEEKVEIDLPRPSNRVIFRLLQLHKVYLKGFKIYSGSVLKREFKWPTNTTTVTINLSEGQYTIYPEYSFIEVGAQQNYFKVAIEYMKAADN